MIGARPTGATITLTFAIVLALASSPPLVLAQTSGSATLSGSVRDATGAVVPDALLTLRNERTQTVYTATSDTTGEFVFAAVNPSLYTLRVELAGFAPYEATGLRLSPNDTLGLDPTLAVAGQKETVAVTAPREVLQTQTGAREGLITAGDIENLSIISRSSLELLRILPGVVAPSLNQMEAVSFAFNGTSDFLNWSVNGLRGTDSLNPVIDGSKVIDFGSNGSVMLTPNSDMVEEVKIQTSNFAAEYGSAGVQLTAVTKSGSRSFHGAVYDYWRSWRLAANDHSNNQAGIPKPKSAYNYPGVNLSGPLLLPGTGFNKTRDRLFFFVGFEYQDQTPDPGTWLGVVPTLRQREGDFGELLDNRGQNLNQPPIVTIPGGFAGAGSPAPNNDVRPYVDPVGKALMSLYPLPNYVDPENRYNYAFHVASPLDRWQLVTRLDWNASARTHAYLRLAYEKERIEWPRGIWSPSSYELPSSSTGDNRGRSASLTVTSVVSPNTTNEVVLSATQGREYNDWDDPSRVTRSGLGIGDFRGIFPPTSPYAPVQIISAGQSHGMLYALANPPLTRSEQSLSIADTLTRVFPAHTVKAGLFVERGQKELKQGTSQDGFLVLGSPWIPYGTGNDYGDLLMGRPFLFGQDTPGPTGKYRFWNVEGFLQDSWKARRNLTLEAGVRVTWMPNNVETQGLGTLFDPARYDLSQGISIDGDPTHPNGVLWAKRGEIPKGMTADPSVKAMPRLGFSWDVRGSGDLVLRGGVGLFYNRPIGHYQYSTTTSNPPNLFHAMVNAWQVPGGLTLAGLRDIDPYQSQAAVDLASLDPASNDLPRTWSWSLSVAKRLPFQQVLEVAYVGNQASHLPTKVPADYIPPGALTGTVGNADLDNPLHRAALAPWVANAFRPYPAYNSVTLFRYEGRSNYNALQATLTRQAGRRFQYLLAYTFGKALGTSGNDFTMVDPLDPDERSYGVVDQDRTHLFNASYNLLLPNPIRLSGNGVLKALLNDWQTSGITSFSSGIPLRLRFGGDLASAPVVRAWLGTDATNWSNYWGYGGSGTITPVYLRDPRTGKTAVGEKLVDINALAFPAFGTSGPYVQPWYIKSPPRWNWDVTVFKNFGLGGQKKLQLRVGFFNLFNQSWADPASGDIDLNLETVCNVHVNGVPNGAGGTSDYVCDASQDFSFTPQTLQNFGKVKTRRGRRVIELAAKFTF